MLFVSLPNFSLRNLSTTAFGPLRLEQPVSKYALQLASPSLHASISPNINFFILIRIFPPASSFADAAVSFLKCASLVLPNVISPFLPPF